MMRELEKHIPNPQTPPTMRQLENMPYLVAIMYETLRVFYGTSHRLQRTFPCRTLQYKQYTIPPGTPISMTVMHIHDNADIFPDPYTFKPERWLAPKEGEKQHPFKYLVAFSQCSRSCVGMDLAKAEILTTLANIFRRLGREMALFATERERDIDVQSDVFNPLPSRESNGLMVMFKKGDDGLAGPNHLLIPVPVLEAGSTKPYAIKDSAPQRRCQIIVFDVMLPRNFNKVSSLLRDYAP